MVIGGGYRDGFHHRGLCWLGGHRVYHGRGVYVHFCGQETQTLHRDDGQPDTPGFFRVEVQRQIQCPEDSIGLDHLDFHDFDLQNLIRLNQPILFDHLLLQILVHLFVLLDLSSLVNVPIERTF